MEAFALPSKNKQRSFIIFFIVFAIIAQTGFSVQASRRSDSLQILDENLPLETRSVITRYLKRLNHMLEKLLRHEPKNTPLPCKILFMNEKLRDNINIVALHDKRIYIYLPADLNIWINDDEFHKKLISALLQCKNGISPAQQANSNKRRVPDWLCAALTHKLRQPEQSQRTMGIKVYPRVRSLLFSGWQPDIWQLIGNPVKPDGSEARAMYSEACELLLDACMKKHKRKKTPITDTILLSARTKTPHEEIFRQTFGKIIISAKKAQPKNSEEDSGQNDDKITLWFQHAVKKSSINYFMPPPSEYAKKVFEEAIIISDSNSKFDISELAERWPQIKDKKLTILKAQKSLTDAKLYIPYFAHGPPTTIILHLAELYTEKAKDFRQKVEKAKEDFFQKMKKMKKIEEATKKAETQNLPIALKYWNYFRILAEEEKEARKNNPKLHKYLDRIEKEYNKY